MGRNRARVKSAALLAGIVIGLILAPFIIYMYVGFGRVPVSAFDPELPFESSLAAKAVRARISREMPATSPMPATETNLQAGAQVYRNNCAMCHGLPGENPPALTIGMYPPPPQLFHGKGVTEDPVGETYWKVENGIRLTGMPGFRETLSTDQMWEVTLLVWQADKLPPSVLEILQAKNATQNVTSPQSAPGAKH